MIELIISSAIGFIVGVIVTLIYKSRRKKEVDSYVKSVLKPKDKINGISH